MGLTPQELRNIAKSRLEDSEVLFNNNRYDGTVYLSGYVIELALKAKIAEEQNTNFPENSGEFKQLNTQMTTQLSQLNQKTLKTHDLDVLVRLTRFINVIDNNTVISGYWDTVTLNWNTEKRYARIGITHIETEELLNAVRELWDKLL